MPQPALIARTLLSSMLAIASLPAFAADTPSAPAAAPCKSTVTGDLRLHTLRSTIFGNERTIRVLLPPGYDDKANAQRRYPVLYLLDGQNVFDACLSDVSHHELGGRRDFAATRCRRPVAANDRRRR